MVKKKKKLKDVSESNYSTVVASVDCYSAFAVPEVFYGSGLLDHLLFSSMSFDSS